MKYLPGGQRHYHHWCRKLLLQDFQPFNKILQLVKHNGIKDNKRELHQKVQKDDAKRLYRMAKYKIRKILTNNNKEQNDSFKNIKNRLKIVNN